MQFFWLIVHITVSFLLWAFLLYPWVKDGPVFFRIALWLAIIACFLIGVVLYTIFGGVAIAFIAWVLALFLKSAAYPSIEYRGY